MVTFDTILKNNQVIKLEFTRLPVTFCVSRGAAALSDDRAPQGVAACEAIRRNGTADAVDG